MKTIYAPRSTHLACPRHPLLLATLTAMGLVLAVGAVAETGEKTATTVQAPTHQHGDAHSKSMCHAPQAGMAEHSAHMAANSGTVSQGSVRSQPMDHSAHSSMMDHSAHMKMMSAQNGYERSMNLYPLPSTELVGADGMPVQLQGLLSEKRPVILNFIFTSCTTVCPILSATLSQASKSFSDDEIRPLMISISIDPQYDTPERLREYASRYHADENWHFLTGELDSIIALQRAFAAYYGNKLNHQPVTFMREGAGMPWVRLQGFTTSADLVAEYRALLDSHS